MSKFTRCESFEDYRAAALLAAQSMDMFEQIFIANPDSSGGVMERSNTPDGEWPPIEAFEETDFIELPDRYPVIAYGSLNEEHDRYGAVKIWVWDWADAALLKDPNVQNENS